MISIDLFKELAKRQGDTILQLKKEIEQLKNELVELQAEKLEQKVKGEKK